MRCAEAQELLTEGQSYCYLNVPGRKSPGPFAEEVDLHVEDCPECGETLIRLLRYQLRRRPGLRHWLQVQYAIRRERDSIASIEVRESRLEQTPLTRVANTVLMEAIKQDAARIELLPTLIRPATGAGAVGEVDLDDDSMIGLIKADIAKATLLGLDADIPRLSVMYEVAGSWNERLSMPHYIKPPLFARFKSMANLLLIVEDEPQEGEIPIRFENRDYVVNIRTSLGPLGEHIVMEIGPA